MTAATKEYRAVERDESIAIEYADRIRPLLGDAKRATGHVAPDHPSRMASDRVNELLMEYFDQNYSVAYLASFLSDDISLAGIRRRIRTARGVRAAKEALERGATEFDYTTSVGSQHKRHREVAKAKELDDSDYEALADSISQARAVGGGEYGDAVRSAYATGASLYVLADLLGMSYYALWSAMRSSY